MSRLVLISVIAAWVGTFILLSEVKTFSRLPIKTRIAPYIPGQSFRYRVQHLTFASYISPLLQSATEKLAGVFGATEPLAKRLDRVGSQKSASQIRVQQSLITLATLCVGATLPLSINTPPVAAIVSTLALPLLAFLVVEQKYALDSSRWQQQLFIEAPIVAEQLSLLISAGYSLTGALSYLTENSNSATSQDISRVMTRIRQGVDEATALREWADRAQVPAITQLVTVLALNRKTSQLSRMISEETRSIRREAQRQLIEKLEKRNQQVWIPVTVAALVPGSILLVIPFLDAVKTFSGS